MKTKIYLLFIGFLFSFTGLSAQNIEAHLETQQSVPFQKLYLHTDREFYFTGDTLWFAAYLLDGQTNIPTLEPCNLYVDLINADGKIIKNELFLIQNGFGSGYVPFSDSVILEGSFILRAYTDYLKNFGDDAFFTKSILVSTVKNSFELQSNNRFSSSQSVDFTNSETLNKNQSAGEVPPVSESFVEATAKIKDKINPEYFITGILKDKNKQPVEFATLYNLTQKTSSITNAFGEFKLEAQIGDSVKIQHLNYKSNYYKIQKKEEEFILVEKDFLIEEVMVSPQFAFDLFNKSCENTWKSFKEENTTKAYAKCTRKLYGKVVAQEAFLDLDIVQKKLQSYKKGEKTSIYRVQEKTERQGKFPENDFLLDLNLFYPSIQQIYWVDLPKSFNYLKREESNFIKLVLSSKSTYDHKCNIEVSINKKDTTLHSFAMVKKDIRLPYLHSKMVRNKVQEVWDTILVQKTYHYIEYDYSEGFGYLSEYVQGAVVKPDREIEILEHLKTYENGAGTLSGRKSNNRIFSNRLVLRAVKNHYETEFWKDNFFPYKFPFDFERLENLKIGE